MTIQEWLTLAVDKLDSDTNTAGLDARIILAEAIDTPSDRIALVEPSFDLEDEQLSKANYLLDERLTGKPISQILGYKEFYGHRFKVTPDVLAPRPESEAIVEYALSRISKKDIQSVADMGTGSGCLILSLAAECDSDDISFVGCDNSKSVLEVAGQNLEALGLTDKVRFLRADLFVESEYLSECLGADLIIANLPYVPDDYPINRDASFDPRAALFSGADGLNHYRQLFEKISQNRPKTVIVEHLPEQYEDINALINSSFDQHRIDRVSPLVTAINF